MNTKLIIGSIIGLLLVGASNSHAQIVYGNGGGYGAYGNGGGGYVYHGGAGYGNGCGGGYGGGYGGYGGYGGGNGSYSRQVSSPGYNSSTTANYSAPYGTAYNNQAVLGGIAAIIGAAAPILQQAIVSAPQQQQPQVIYIQAK